MIENLSHFIIQLINQSSYFGIFVLMALESALIPIPSEVTMPFAGFLASQGRLDFWLVVATGTLANLFGSLTAYYVGLLLEETVLVNLIKKYGKFILVTYDDYQKATSWFVKHGEKVVFVSRMLPAIRTVISLPAGVFKMNKVKFISYTVLGSLVWCTILTYVGFVSGKNWNSLEPIYRKFELGVLALVVFGVIFYLNHKLKLVKLKG